MERTVQAPLPPRSDRRPLLLALLALALRPASAVAADAPVPPPAVQEQLVPKLALRVIGRDVKGPGGVVVAQVMNVLVDEDGQPRAAVLDYGGFMGVGRRRIAVAWRALQFAPDGIALGLSRDQLRNFPEYKDGEAVVVAGLPDGDAARPE